MHTPPQSQSIHPRAIYPNGRKKNTAAPHSARHGGAGGKTHRKAQKRLMARVRAYEAQSDKQGCRKPGSMQP